MTHALASQHLAAGTYLELASNIRCQDGSRLLAGTLCRVLSVNTHSHPQRRQQELRIEVEADGRRLDLWLQDGHLAPVPDERRAELVQDDDVLWYHHSPQALVEVWDGIHLPSLRPVSVTFREGAASCGSWRAEVKLDGMCVAVEATRSADSSTAERLVDQQLRR